MLQSEYWISELATASGVSTRTIRYYIQEGLLPQPEIRGKYAIFTNEYMHRLRLIKFMKDAYLPLNKIRELLNTLSDDQIAPMLEEFEKDPVNALGSLKALSVSTPPSHPPERMENQSNQKKDSALEYIKHVRGQTLVSEPLHPPYKLDFIQSGELNLRVENQPAEEWQRILLVPGLELHLRRPVPKHIQRLVDQLLEVVKYRGQTKSSSST